MQDVVKITLRLPKHLWTKIEDKAKQAGIEKQSTLIVLLCNVLGIDVWKRIPQQKVFEDRVNWIVDNTKTPKDLEDAVLEAIGDRRLFGVRESIGVEAKTREVIANGTKGLDKKGLEECNKIYMKLHPMEFQR